MRPATKPIFPILLSVALVLALAYLVSRPVPVSADLTIRDLDDLPAEGGPGWPIDVIFVSTSLSTPDLSGPSDSYVERFRAESWSEWRAESVDPKVLDELDIAASSPQGCAVYSNGAIATGTTCNGDLTVHGPSDRMPGDPMGVSSLLRPLAGLDPSGSDYVVADSPMSGHTGRPLIEATLIEPESCRDAGYACDGAKATRTTHVVADRSTWVPLLVEIEVQGVVVSTLRAVQIDGVPVT